VAAEGEGVGGRGRKAAEGDERAALSGDEQTEEQSVGDEGGVRCLSETSKRRFYKMFSTSLKSGRREYI
jgi:hypothetical protein